MLRVALGALGLFYLANGAWMIVAPWDWYGATPGVTATGPMNPHFIADIGLAFLASGAGLGFRALREGPTAAALAVAGATWPALHALFHIWLWFAHGFPNQPAIAATEVFGVVGLAALGLWLAAKAARQEGVI